MTDTVNSVSQVELKEMTDGSGDIFFELPALILNKLGWKPGDEVKFQTSEDGSFTIKKIKYETIELYFDDEELFDFMKIAHDKNMSFNEFVECALKAVIES
tara:strand:- start:271 stop:573 length:303 start_codon:yes stop_codon:yes gene_type:complete